MPPFGGGVAAAIAALGALVAYLTAQRLMLSGALSLVSLLATALAAALLPFGPALPFASAGVHDSFFARVFLVAGALTLAALQLVALAYRRPLRASALPAVLATAWLALAVDERSVAIVAAIACGLAGLAARSPSAATVGVRARRRSQSRRAAASSTSLLRAPYLFRSLAAAGALAVVGTLVARPSLSEWLPSVAILCLAGALVARLLLVVPRSLMRVAGQDPAVVPVLVAWSTLPFAVLVGEMARDVPAPPMAPGAVEAAIRLAPVAAGAVSVVVAGLAAVVVRRPAHVLTLIVLQAAALSLVAIVVPVGPDVRAQIDAAVRAWLVITSAAATALGGAALAFAAVRRAARAAPREAPIAAGTDPTASFAGSFRGSPLAAGGLCVAVVALVGWPGTLALESRAAIVNAAVPREAAYVLLATSFLPLAALARAAWSGLRHPSADRRMVLPLRLGDRRRPQTWRIAREGAADLLVLLVSLGALGLSVGLSSLAAAASSAV